MALIDERYCLNFRMYEEQVSSAWNLSLLKLNPLDKVPSDIEVARAQTPKDIDLLASEIGRA